MSITVRDQGWPSDPGHRDAIDTLLDMASAADRWGEDGRALLLLEQVEQIVGVLPAGYQRMRRRCERGVTNARLRPRGVQFPNALVASTRRGGGRFSGR